MGRHLRRHRLHPGGDDNSDFSSITYTAPVAGTSHVPTVDLPVNTHLYWRVRASNACGTGADSAVFNFSTSAPFSYCRTPGLAIPDNNPGGANDVLVIAASGTIADVDIQLVVTHTWVGDLKFTLSNGGAPVAFYDRPGYTGSGFGCSGDNINATVNDEGPDGNVESQCANLPATSGDRIGGDPASSTLLTAFDGQPVAGSYAERLGRRRRRHRYRYLLVGLLFPIRCRSSTASRPPTRWLEHDGPLTARPFTGSTSGRPFAGPAVLLLRVTLSASYQRGFVPQRSSDSAVKPSFSAALLLAQAAAAGSSDKIDPVGARSAGALSRG